MLRWPWLLGAMATGGVFTKGSGVTTPQFDVGEIRAMVELASHGGRRVAAHCHGNRGIENAARGGGDEEEQRTRVGQGVLFGSGLIAGEGVTGIGIAVFALILGHKPEGVSFALSGVPGSLLSVAAFAFLCWLLVRSTGKETA